MGRSGLGRLKDKVASSLRRNRRDGSSGAPAGGKGDGIVVGYAPERDGDADPGEVVWTWVPYEDDPSQGKDRPVLILGHDGPLLAGVPLSSKDHSQRTDAHEWVSVGRGGWDREDRVSYADASRLLRIDPHAVRREGAALHRDRFDEVIHRVRSIHGWQG